MQPDPNEYLNECCEALAKATDEEAIISALWWKQDAELWALVGDRP